MDNHEPDYHNGVCYCQPCMESRETLGTIDWGNRFDVDGNIKSAPPAMSEGGGE